MKLGVWKVMGGIIAIALAGGWFLSLILGMPMEIAALNKIQIAGWSTSWVVTFAFVFEGAKTAAIMGIGGWLIKSGIEEKE